jgi:hypothetical protein
MNTHLEKNGTVYLKLAALKPESLKLFLKQALFVPE